MNGEKKHREEIADEEEGKRVKCRTRIGPAWFIKPDP